YRRKTRVDLGHVFTELNVLSIYSISEFNRSTSYVLTDSYHESRFATRCPSDGGKRSGRFIITARQTSRRQSLMGWYERQSIFCRRKLERCTAILDWLNVFK